MAANMTKSPFIIPCVSYQTSFNAHSFTISHIYCVSISPTRNLSKLKLCWQKMHKGEKAAAAAQHFLMT